jgi:hypothetical protein
MNDNSNPIRKWFSNLFAEPAMHHMSEQEIRRLAADAGVIASDFHALMRRPKESLLPRRIEALGLNAELITRKHPATMRDMQRVCAFCDRRGTCARDLARSSAGERWRGYCPNAPTLDEFAAEVRAPLAKNNNEKIAV